MTKENFYSLREMEDQLQRQNAAELSREMDGASSIRRSYPMHTPDEEVGVSVGRPEDARCKYFGTF